MKITILTKRISTNVIAISAAEALRLLLESEEAADTQVNSAQVARVASPNAPKQTVDFVVQSGVHVLGYFEGLADYLETNPTAVDVWAVTVDLEYVVEFDPPKQEFNPTGTGATSGSSAGTVVGSIGREDVVDPNDRAGLPAVATPPADAKLQSSVTEGDI